MPWALNRSHLGGRWWCLSHYGSSGSSSLVWTWHNRVAVPKGFLLRTDGMAGCLWGWRLLSSWAPRLQGSSVLQSALRAHPAGAFLQGTGKQV